MNMEHPPYSSHLILYDLFMPPKLNISMEESHFESLEDMQSNAMTILKGLPAIFQGMS
jgi:hypothetical protein